jgi:4-amino-4-deoxy-L-arabinose transferase-like glycosyltransferase
LARRLVRGRAEDPRWARPALLGLLLGTAALYLFGLGASGWANGFYSAAVQAGSVSWKAFFFGSFDSANAITVDKPPASLWVMAASVRLFGLSSWSILVPQALMGVGSVALLHATVRRWSGPAAGLLAGAALAVTPVAVLMFRFNNPDALLTLLLVAAAYATVRAIERGSTRWLLLAASFVGFGFLAKMLQALLVVPALALAYLVAAPGRVRRRIGQLLLAGLALLVSAGWWVAIVELVPASARPYIGGSQHNSVLELVFGYNGFGRLTGSETGSVGGGQGGGWGATGWGRMFNAEIGGQVAWLLPAALLFLAAGLWQARSAPRVDRTRAALLLWGGWLLATGLVFSFMAGIFHAYYTVALAPAIAALVGIGTTVAWRRRSRLVDASVLAAALGGTSVWSFVLLRRSTGWHPWLASTVLIGGLLATLGLLLLAVAPSRVAAARGRLAVVVAATGLLAALAGPTAYALQTASTVHTGSIPTAGPTVAGARGGPGGGPGGGAGGGAAGGGPAGGPGAAGSTNGQAGGAPPAGTTGAAAGGTTTQDGTGAAGGLGGLGGLLNSGTPSAELTAALQADAASYTWVAATVGANNAAGYQLASGDPVLAIGGFNGSDPSPTLAQFTAYVAAGRIHYFLTGGTGAGGSTTAQQIAAWVTANYQSRTVGGTTVYDLSGG